MFNSVRLRLAAAMAQVAALAGLRTGPEIQYSPQAMQAPRFRAMPRTERRGRIFWPSSQKGTYVRPRADAIEDARLQRYQAHCNKNFRKRHSLRLTGEAA